MDENKIHLINKIFNNETIRIIWDNEEEKYYISIVDIVSIISESRDGRKYWNKLKQRLKNEGNETVTNCHQLKLKANDGKYRMTDVYDIEEMFRIIESIPSKNASLPIIAACILNRGTSKLYNVPKIHDTQMMYKILEELGCTVKKQKIKLL